MAGLDGIALGCIAAGAVLTYAGIRGKSIPSLVQGFVQGTSPAAATSANQISTTSSDTSSGSGTVTATGGEPSGTNAANQALGRLMAAPYGWSTGSEWTALNNVVMAESGWSDTVVNESSGAAGIAQNISGFGPGYESGNAPEQIAWLLSYIKSRYGNPEAAWAHEQSYGWY